MIKLWWKLHVLRGCLQMIEIGMATIIAFPSNVTFHGFVNIIPSASGRDGGGGGVGGGEKDEPRHSVNGLLGFFYIGAKAKATSLPDELIENPI